MTPEEAIEYLKNPFASGHDGEGFDKAIKLAIKALEKQMPMKRMEEHDIVGRPIRVCGNCGDAPGGDYCRWCGQKQA